jgi:site-specific recombinase XerD
MSTPDLISNLNPAGEKSRPHVGNVKGSRWPADPIRVEEFAALLSACVPLVPGHLGQVSADRLRALIVVLFRTGVRISEALAFEETDLNRSERSLVVKRGKGGKRRPVVIDEWGLDELERWLRIRQEFPPGAIFCVIRGRTVGRPMKDCDVRRQLAETARRAGLRRRANAHAFRHGFAVESRHEGIDYLSLQRQLGHARLDVTENYLRGIDYMEVLAPFGRRKPPMIVVPAGGVR